MMARLNRALDTLRKLQQAERGVRCFTGTDDGRYWESPARREQFSYERAIQGMNGEAPEGVELWTKDQVDQLAADGWMVITIVYADMSGAGTHSGEDALRS